MNAPLEIDTLVAELVRAKAEGATFVILQSIDRKAATAHQCLPLFGFHDPNIIGAYVIGGERLTAADWVEVTS